MGVLLVVNVLSLGLQATGARGSAPHPDDRAQIERESAVDGLPAPLVLCALGSLLLAAPLVIRHARPGLLGGRRAGRGHRVPADGHGRPGRHPPGRAPLAGRWPGSTSPSGSVGSSSAPSALLLRPDTLGAHGRRRRSARFAPVVIGWLALRHPTRAAGTRPATRSGRGRALGARRRAARDPHNSHALLAFFALSNVDVLIARMRPRRAPGRALRRRADPGQGGAVPAPVRGGHRLPVDGAGPGPRGGCT